MEEEQGRYGDTDAEYCSVGYKHDDKMPDFILCKFMAVLSFLVIY